ncbi:pyridoxal-phosphate dependent enzyme [Exilibacterium tricleocarpae]|uniref:Cysteine synthase B n=1 Tax=Exilibacterium tricleocarpae TaxID=2591008 RepID=A0A545SNI3_9GAMM|nr:pyridoxal-phosphate dependent enzyme [Exilibacterium tricleocarpae]TQV66514.1 pyridoxal-phosphate dependent enzyme [Exilibacterium tricleocarpae]
MLNVNPPADSVLDLIGNTPMVRVNRLDTGPCALYLKLESQNPGGSIKDRIGLSMINAAEAEGLIKPGGTLVEATAGNTGLGLALVAYQKGYKLKLVIPDKMSRDKIMHLQAMGVEVVLTRSDVGKGHPEYYQDMAERIAAETPNAFFINQFGNPANVLAHETTTGPEIWAQMQADVDAFVAGVGSGGTVTGNGRFLKQKNPDIDIILADPEGSVLAEAVATGTPAKEVGSWVVEGIGEDFVPDILDLSLVDKAYSIPDREALAVVRELLLKEGILAGTSSGTLIAAALRYCRAQTTPKRVVTFVCDTGNKYLSKAYNDYWMKDHGFLQKETFGDLRDFISHHYASHDVVTLRPNDTLMAAYGKMKLYEVSQLPVVAEDGRLAGILDETDVLLAVKSQEDHFGDPVAGTMSQNLKTVPPTAKLDDLIPLFDKGMVPIIADDQQFYGLITRIDVINHLREELGH